MPKEIRNLKSEKPRIDGDAIEGDSEFWNWGDEAANGASVLNDEPQRDLMERTAIFGEAIVRFAKKIPHSPENVRLISQLVGAGTSIGANYCEADDSVSGKILKNPLAHAGKNRRKRCSFFAWWLHLKKA